MIAFIGISCVAGYTLAMPPPKPVPEQPIVSEPAPRTPLKPKVVVRREEGGGGAGFGTQVLLMMAIFGSATCVTMLGPLLVDLSQDLDVSLGQAGLLAAAMAVTWALAAPFAGVLSDRFGRRPLIVMALLGLGAVTLGAALAPDFGVLLVMRTLAGIFGGFGPAVLYLPSFLMLGYGLDAVAVAPILVLMAVGSIVGTLGGGWLGDRLPKAAIFVIAQGLAAAIALILFTQTPGLAISAVGGAVFTLVNASSRPALLALSTELSTRYRGAILGVFSVTNQAGIVLGSSVGGLAIGLGGYGVLALTMAVDGVLASGLALPLLRRRRPASTTTT